MIQKNFDRASHSYEKVAFIQRQVAESLVNILKKFDVQNINTILDLGTGTGYIPELLLSNHCNANYSLNDISSCMLNICRKKFLHYSSQFEYINYDMETLNFQNYDLIISNLAMQWAKDIYSLIQKCCENSKIFIFSTLLNGTFQEWQEIIYEYENTNILKEYPTANFLVLQCNFSHYEVQEFKITFDSPLQFLYYLQQLGVMYSEKSLQLKTLKKLIRIEKPLSVTYKVFLGIRFNNNI